MWKHSIHFSLLVIVHDTFWYVHSSRIHRIHTLPRTQTYPPRCSAWPIPSIPFIPTLASSSNTTLVKGDSCLNHYWCYLTGSLTMMNTPLGLSSIVYIELVPWITSALSNHVTAGWCTRCIFWTPYSTPHLPVPGMFSALSLIGMDLRYGWIFGWGSRCECWHVSARIRGVFYTVDSEVRYGNIFRTFRPRLLRFVLRTRPWRSIWCIMYY